MTVSFAARKDIHAILGAREQYRIKLLNRMGLIRFIYAGDNLAEENRNPFLFHNLGRIVFVAVKDYLFPFARKFYSIWKQLRIMKLINICIHFQSFLINCLRSKKHSFESRRAVHWYLNNLHTLFGCSSYRRGILCFDYKGDIVSFSCKRCTLLVKDTGIVWRMCAGKMANFGHTLSLPFCNIK